MTRTGLRHPFHEPDPHRIADRQRWHGENSAARGTSKQRGWHAVVGEQRSRLLVEDLLGNFAIDLYEHTRNENIRHCFAPSKTSLEG